MFLGKVVSLKNLDEAFFKQFFFLASSTFVWFFGLLNTESSLLALKTAGSQDVLDHDLRLLFCST